MTTITVCLDDGKAESLENRAREYGLTVDRLILASIDDLINQPDPDFERAMKHVISENAELYRRLA